MVGFEMLLDYVSSKGGDRRLHPGAGARGRARRDHRQRDRPGRVPDRRGEDPPRPRGLQPVGARPAVPEAARHARGHRQPRRLPRERRVVVHHRPDRRRSTAAGRCTSGPMRRRSTARSRSSPVPGTGSARRSRVALADAGARVAVTHHDGRWRAERGGRAGRGARGRRARRPLDGVRRRRGGRDRRACSASRPCSSTAPGSTGSARPSPSRTRTGPSILDVNLTGVYRCCRAFGGAHARGRAGSHRQHRVDHRPGGRRCRAARPTARARRASSG